MAHLMKLELKKVHFLRYILISAGLILLGMFFLFVALHDSSDSPRTFDNSFRTVQMIFAFVYVIFFAVLVSAVVISEYNNKTILLMFTYPIDKSKMILSKLLVITLFMAASMLIGYVCCSLFIVGMDRRSDLIVGEFSSEILGDWIFAALFSTIIFCCLGLWTFVAGMMKKSVTVTIFIFLRQIVITSGENHQENIWMVLAAVIISLAVLRYTFAKKITQIDLHDLFFPNNDHMVAGTKYGRLPANAVVILTPDLEFRIIPLIDLTGQQWRCSVLCKMIDYFEVLVYI